MASLACDAHDNRLAGFVVSLLSSNSPSNLALMCIPCVVAWLHTIEPTESWEIRRVTA